MTLQRFFALIGALMMLALAQTAAAQSTAAERYDLPPVPEGPVYDEANILSVETEAALDARLRDYNRETGNAIVVATVPSLDGAEIEPYATALYADWGIGGAQRDTGLLLLVAPNDRRVRIEVGYGLHPWFGGIMAGRVINDVITPRFKAGDFDGGVTQGIDAILAHLATSPEDAVTIEEAAQAAAEQQRQSDGGFPIGTLIWFGFIAFFFILPMLRGGGRGRRRRYGVGSAVGDIVLWEAGKAIARGFDGDGGGFGGSGFGGGGGGGGFGGFGGGMSGGGGASGGW